MPPHAWRLRLFRPDDLTGSVRFTTGKQRMSAQDLAWTCAVRRSMGALSFEGRIYMVRKLLMVMLVSGGFALAGCNTVRGLGHDLESVANEVDQET